MLPKLHNLRKGDIIMKKMFLCFIFIIVFVLFGTSTIANNSIVYNENIITDSKEVTPVSSKFVFLIGTGIIGFSIVGRRSQQ